MSEDIPFDEALQLELLEKPFPGDSQYIPDAVPTRAGLQWLAVPSSIAGLAYRIRGGTTLEAVSFDPQPQVQSSVELSSPAVHIACSADGRLVAAACMDGSLQCFNATSSSLEPRWSLSNVHSHVVSQVSESNSSCRDAAASESGPIRSLQFSPTGYALLVVDAGNEQLSIYNAESTLPVDLFQNHSVEATCAAWSTATTTNGELSFAVGCLNGKVHLMSITLSTGTTKLLSTIPPLQDQTGFVCTHLDWFAQGNYLATGYCKVTPSDDDDDSDDEDDAAEHETLLTVGTIQENQLISTTNLGDVVPFFSVPRHGRHVFFTSYVSSNQEPPILLVASNVASDIGIVSFQNGKWLVVDLQEGFNATTPTNADDEYTFPMGIGTIALPEEHATRECLVVAATDGSLSVFGIQDQTHPEAFLGQVPVSYGIASLPTQALEATYDSPPLEAEEPGEPELAEEPEPVVSPPETSAGFFGSTSAFGSPSFSQPSQLGGAPAFGQPSQLGGGATPQQPTASATPTFGSGTSAPIFGSASSVGSGGFGALAASTTLDAKPSAFDAFGTRSPQGSLPSSMVKPLFGSSSPAKEETKEETTPTPIVPAEETTNLPGATKAGRVFDEFDKNHTGTLPMDKFEDIVDELGEGLYGDELQAQMKIIDPNGTNQMTRESFVSWYAALLASADDDDSASVGSREKEKRAARDAFASLSTSTGEGGVATILAEDFHRLLEAMGTTYCDEAHSKYKRKLTRSDGMIYCSDFEEWYVDWIFEGDESSEEEQEPPQRGVAAEGGWGDMFAPKENEWKCPICMVQNKESVTKCAACETPRASGATTSTAAAAAVAAPTDSTGSSIGSGGFSFGGYGGLFGSAAAAAPASASSAAAPGGISFAGGSAAPGDKKESGGFSFGIKKDETERSTTKKTESAGGSSYPPLSGKAPTPFGAGKSDAPKPSASSSGYPPMASKAPEPFGGGKLEAKPSSSGGYPPMASKAPGPVESLKQAKPASTATSSQGAFGSSGVTPTFGSGNAAPLFGSSGSGPFGGAAQGSKPAPLFDAFKKPETPGSITSSMVKPLFGSSSTEAAKKEAPAAAPTVSEDEAKAGRVFDSFDKDKEGTLSMDKFEDLLDELGEGLYGDELEGQMKIIDPDGTSQMTRAAFVSWYVAFLAAADEDDDASVGSREAEQQSAREAFMSLSTSTGEDGVATIAKDDFSQVLEDMGTTYCEEAHAKYAKRLTRSDGMIYCNDFEEWYVDWIFEDESSDDETESEAESPQRNAAAEGGWGDMFAPKENEWKCPICMVQNKESDTKCAACETPRAGGAASSTDAAAAAASADATGSSIGSGGFTFGGGGGSGGLFGSAAAAAPAPASSAATPGGFSCGGGSAAPGGFSFGTSATAEAADEDKKASSESGGFSFGVKKDEAESSETKKAEPVGGSSYPPLSGKAPIPFGAGPQDKAAAPSKSSDSSSYPPMASKGPVPFGGGKASAPAPAKSSSSSGYPPVASTAPTPFTAAVSTSKSAAPPKSSGASGYPPMASKGPVPFGGGKPATSAAKSSSSAGYPPVASTAPTPFAAAGTINKPAAPPKSIVSSGYPPMSSKGPIPFGGGIANAPAAAKPSSSAGYPPAASTAPTPFGSGTTTSKSAAPSKPSASSSGYPPMSSTGPVPFGGGKTTPSSASKAGPFGGKTGTFGDSFKAGAMSGFSPVSSTAPIGSSKAGGPFGGRSPAVTRTSLPPRRASTGAQPSQWKQPASSEYESQYRKVADQFAKSIYDLSSSPPQQVDSSADFQRRITELVDEKASLSAVCSELYAQSQRQKERSVFLLSRKTDIERQTDESRRMINSQTASQAESSNVIQSQPLDAESERTRRNLAVKAVMVNKMQNILEGRSSLLRGILDDGGMDLTVSRSDRKNTLFEAITSEYRHTQQFQDDVARLEDRVSKYSESIPAVVSGRAGSSPLSQTGDSTTPSSQINSRRSRHRLTPVKLPSSSAKSSSRSLTRHGSKTNSAKWSGIERVMRGTKPHEVPTKKLTKLSRIGSSSAKDEQSARGRRNNELAQSLLLSPAKTAPQRKDGIVVRREPLVFSSPIGEARSDWESVLASEQAKVQASALTVPSRLQEIDTSQAAVKALAAFGTTPEKADRALEMKRDAGSKLGPTQASSKAALGSSGKGTSSTAAAFPPMSAKAPTTPAFGMKTTGKDAAPKSSGKGASSAAAFPPMSAKAPTPPAFSSKTTGKEATSGSSGKGASSVAAFPPLSAKAPTTPAFGSKPTEKGMQQAASKPPVPTKEASVDSAASTRGVSLQPKTPLAGLSQNATGKSRSDSSAFGLQGLSDSLFSSTNDKVTPPASNVTTGGAGTTQPPAAKDKPDYRSILNEFYTRHNPAKVDEVDKTLEKYKGREIEMFRKLGNKYGVPSPLESKQSTPAPSPFGAPSVATKPSGSSFPMSTVSGASGGPSPFTGFGNATAGASSQASPSPFGNPVNASPFGQAASPATTSGFGAAAPPSPSPFSQSPSQTPSFGGGVQQAPSKVLVGGRDAREMLTAFYQKYNPSKLGEVDKLLEKYKNQEQKLFLNLAKKYSLDPSTFGISSPAPPPLASAMGQQGGFGQAPQQATGAFGAASPAPAFGSTGSAFGQQSSLGQPMSAFQSPPAAAPGGHTFGSSSTIGGGQPTFGSLATGGAAAAPSPFGAGTQTGGGFGSAPATGFGAMSGGFGGTPSPAAPFGAPRR